MFGNYSGLAKCTLKNMYAVFLMFVSVILLCTHKSEKIFFIDLLTASFDLARGMF